MFPIHGRDQNKNTFLHVNVQILKRDFFFSSFRNKTFRNRLMNPPPPSPKKLLCIVSDNAANLSEVLWIRVVLQSGGRPVDLSPAACVCAFQQQAMSGWASVAWLYVPVVYGPCWQQTAVLLTTCGADTASGLSSTLRLCGSVCFFPAVFSANIKSLFEGQRPAH